MRNSRQLVGSTWVDGNGKIWFVDKWVRKGIYDVSHRSATKIITGTMQAEAIRRNIAISRGLVTAETIIIDGSTSDSWQQMVLEDHAALTKGANDGH